MDKISGSGTSNRMGERVGKSRAFISDEPLIAVNHGAAHGVIVKVRLTSYRSLPLSCIEAVNLRIDGVDIDPTELRLTINYTTHKVGDLPHLSLVWWFILDQADLYAPLREPLSPGLHDVAGTLVTVEPYITAGRFSFYNSASKRLPVEPPLQEVRS